MKRFFLFLFWLPAPQTVAQVMMKNGKITVQDTLYCFYEESKTKTSDLHLHTKDFDISEGFRDYYFITKADSFPAIRAEASVLAHPAQAYLIYYYRFSFLPAGSILNIRYHPLTIENFVKDLAAFHVFKEGVFQNTGAIALMKKWSKKSGALSEAFVQEGVSSPYIQEGNERVNDSLVKDIVVAGGNIFLSDSLIATYQLGAPYDPSAFSGAGRRTYYIKNIRGKELLVLTVPEARAQAFVLLLPEKEALNMVIADKREEKLMRTAVGILLLKQKL